MSSNHKKPLFIAFIAGLGMFLSTLDSGIITIALPSLSRYFHTNINVLTWTITVYNLTLSASILLFGQLADRYGRLRVYRLGLIGFAATSFLCGAAFHEGLLIFFRVLQGASSAMMQATSLALLTSYIDEKHHNKAFALFGVLTGLGSMLGPVVGGFILTILSWHYLFWINLPICLYAWFACRQFPAIQEILHRQRLKVISLSLFACSVLLLLLTLNSIDKSSTLLYGLAILFFMALIGFCYREKQAISKLLDYHLFKRIRFTIPMFGLFCLGACFTMSMMLPPLYWQSVRHFATWQIGLICFSFPLGAVIAAKNSARLNAWWGIENTLLLGFLLMSISTSIFSLIHTSWSIPVFMSVLFIFGLGTGSYQAPSYLYIATQAGKHKQGNIAALIRMALNLGITFTAACLSFILILHKHVLTASISGAWRMIAVLAITMSLLLLLLKYNTKSAR